MSENRKSDAGAAYVVCACAPADLSEPELAACIAVIKAGAAVAVSLAKLQSAQLMAVARTGNEIVGVGTIKCVRPAYAAGIASRSKFPFSAQMSELGYVAVDPRHQRRGLSRRLVEALLKIHRGDLFATTYDARMKKTLVTAGFMQKGAEWQGRGGSLSLWLKAIEKGG